MRAAGPGVAGIPKSFVSNSLSCVPPLARFSSSLSRPGSGRSTKRRRTSCCWPRKNSRSFWKNPSYPQGGHCLRKCWEARLCHLGWAFQPRILPSKWKISIPMLGWHFFPDIFHFFGCIPGRGNIPSLSLSLPLSLFPSECAILCTAHLFSVPVCAVIIEHTLLMENQWHSVQSPLYCTCRCNYSEIVFSLGVWCKRNTISPSSC